MPSAGVTVDGNGHAPTGSKFRRSRLTNPWTEAQLTGVTYMPWMKSNDFPR